MQIETISANATIGIRHRVLWSNKSRECCLVDGDEDGAHFGIYTKDELVGVASVFDISGSARLRALAVEKQHQGNGFGSALIAYALRSAQDKGATVFWCDARESAIGFYKKFGFSVEGDRFYKSEISYYKMTINLSLRS